jgi:hypothetical protein
MALPYNLRFLRTRGRVDQHARSKLDPRKRFQVFSHADIVFRAAINEVENATRKPLLGKPAKIVSVVALIKNRQC